MAPAEGEPGSVAVSLNVEVAVSPGPRQVNLVPLSLPQGATVRDAIVASGVLSPPGAGGHPPELPVGIWGRKATLDTVLREGDRVECYRSLKVDPKEARRSRYRAHGEKLPKGIHRPRARVVDLTQASGGLHDDPAD